MCYVTSWSQYRNGEGQFISDNLDANLCTHLVFAFANMENNELTYESTQDTSYYNDLSDLKLMWVFISIIIVITIIVVTIIRLVF